MVLKIFRKTVYSRGGRGRMGHRKKRGLQGNKFLKDKREVDMERLTKIPSGKIIQEMEKETKGLAGEQDWLLMA